MRFVRSALIAVLSSALGATSQPTTAPTSSSHGAPSVHLFYPSPEANAFYCEVRVRESVPSTFFMCCGFSHGYFGIQDHGNRKNVIFSVWDPTKGNDPKGVPEDQQVEVVAHDDDVPVSRFGGEGTGAHCFLNYAWKIGQTYRCLVTARAAGGRTQYTAYFYLPETKSWKRLATFRRVTTSGESLRGLYSFVEDFRRTAQSTAQVRRAEFGNGWTRDLAGQWHALTKANFTGAGKADLPIDAAVVNPSFYMLQTGGQTRNTILLKEPLLRSGEAGEPPRDLPLPN